MSKSIDLTSKEWRDLVFEGKNKEYGAYQMRQKSPKRHWVAIVCTVVGLLVLGAIIWGYTSYSNKKAEEEALAKAAEMQAAAMAAAEEEAPEEEEEEIEEIKYEEPEEVVEEAIAAQMVTEIAIEDVVDKEREVKTVEEVQQNEAQIGAVNQEGKIDISQVNDAVKEVVVAPVAPKVEPIKKPEPEKIFEAVEEKATFPGGQAAMMKWLGNNIKYPEIAQQNGTEGKVTVKFTVEKDGSISNPTIAKGVDKDLDREAIRVVKKMPHWKPGKNNGVAVRSYFYLPVVFKLQKN